MNKEKKSFFERLTGAVRVDRDHDELAPVHPTPTTKNTKESKVDWMAEDQSEGELTVDVYQTPDEIVIKTMVAGVRPEDLDVSITRDMVTIKGTREMSREVEDDQYFHQELYWGSFSRTIMLPEEVDVEGSEASEKYGLLSITLPKIERNKQTKLRIKSNS